MPAANLWNRVLDSLKDEVNTHIYNTWFGPLEPRKLNGENLILEAPDSFIRDWIEENYMSTLTRKIQSLSGSNIGLKIIIGDGPEHPPAPVSREVNDKKQAINHPSRGHQENQGHPNGNRSLNPRYTFDSFVVGSSNQFARAAAMAVADNPARSYNPLFIYGGVGLGKTHLMHAIGHHVQKQNRSAKLCYLSSERFMNDLINSLRFDRMVQFREMYRNMDVLLVDDIQFIAGKERTQEEFFHTFNTLFDSHKQIVVSSDKFPREIPDLEERLRSRFEWGLVADIQPPDLETKIAILEKKAELSGISLPKEVSLFLAENTTSNIRELEGYLLRIIAFATIKQAKVITMSLAQESLKNFLEQRKKIITVDQIQKEFASFYNVKVSDLKSKKKNKIFILPRHGAMYLTRQLTDLSLPEIGRHFGGRDHTTVIHALQKVENILSTDADYNKILNSLTKKIENP